MTAYELGQCGEELAITHLNQLGMQILEQRWKDNAFEIDIVAFDPVSNELVIVEVKTRASGSWGRPEDAVDMPKIRRMVRAADYYVRSRDINYPIRFDIFAIVIPKSGKPKVEYYKDAFYAPLE